ncbi:MAG TPA: DUF4175 family protein [Polyangiales bacterium]|nr:DUF4175 family protein [Polyangiales bacterium]
MPESQRALESAELTLPSAIRALTQYLGRVGRRVLWFKLLRGVAFAAGTAGFLVLIGALAIGPSLSLTGAGLVWALVLAATALAGAVGVGSLEDLRGPRQAKLLSAYHPGLSSRARSAAELARTPNGSPELIASLAHGITQELSALPLSTVVPAPRHYASSVCGALALALLSALLISQRDDAAAGLYALLHPGAHDAQGTLVGLWVGSLRARVSYPPASGREVDELAQVRSLSVPEGASIELTLQPRLAVERAVLKLGERTLPWRRQEDGSLTLTLTAEESAKLELRARMGASWISDPEPRELRVDKDTAPVVELLTPLTDQEAEPNQHVPFGYRAKDDHGLDGVDLVVQLGPNRERRLRVQSFAERTTTLRDEGSADVVPAAFGARPGQTLAVWIEARDRDAVGGANVGRSPVRTIRIGDAEGEKGPELPLLLAARDRALDALAERLENPRHDDAAKVDPARARKTAKATRELIEALSALADGYEDVRDGASANESLIRDMNRRISRLLREEAGGESWARVDKTAVAELEEDALWLNDLIGRAKLEAAEGALSRLSATRQRMRKLLNQLKQSDDPAQRAELLAEINRARAELNEIGERLSQAEPDVPGDFVNYDALRRDADDDPLQQLERALAQGDLDAAEKALGMLDERMASLESGLQGGSEAFGNARFSPRNAALEKAKAEVKQLQESQEQLAKESDRVAQRARGRGPEQRAFEAENERLSQRSQQLEKRTRELEAARMQPAVAESQRTAAQRLKDAHDALRQGEAGEARNMAERAASDLQALAAEMKLDARMYPGHDNSRPAAARKAEELARDVAKLANEIAQNLPGEPDELSSDERQALQKQAPTQKQLGERAGKLAEASREDGPAGMQGGLDRAAQSMKDAQDALEQGELGKARTQQREALDRLRDVSRQIEQQQKASRGGRSQGEGRGEGRESTSDEKVAIPQNEGDSRRNELRRRVLDARRAGTPDTYERSVERYYQEILR